MFEQYSTITAAPSKWKIAFLENQRLRPEICRASPAQCHPAATCEQTSCLWTGALRATTKRGDLPSGFAAGMSRRRFDLKVELQAIRLPFDIPAPSTFVKRRRAIPTFGSRQAPRHEPGFARHEYPRTKTIPVNPMFVQPAKQACSCAALGRIRVLAGGGTPRVEA